MKKLEIAPNWKDSKWLNKGIKLLSDNNYKKIIEKINSKYLYWNKVKYKKTPDNIKPQILWSAVKFSRFIHSEKVRLGNYTFQYNITNYIQKELHKFDMNVGGQSDFRLDISPEEKKRYLIDSIMEEAIASSQIEGAVTTREKAKDMLLKNKNPRTKSEQMILNNFLTIKYIVENKNQTLNDESIFKIHKLITSQTLDNKKYEGRYRTNNKVNVVDVVKGEIVHTPPKHKEIRGLMKELFDFFNEKNEKTFIHPVIKASIIHFMLGYIHPFVDGNGRTARALFYWYLLKNNYWLTEYLSISRMIIKTKNQYSYAFLFSEIDENDITYFINYQIKILARAFENFKEYVQRKNDEKKRIIYFQKIKGINQRQAQILKWFYDKPEILMTVKEIENRFGISNQTARTDLYKLVEKGYLELIEINNKTKAFCRNEKFENVLHKELSGIF